MTSGTIPSDIDVAFTFLAPDEETAQELARMLRGTLSTFVYSERQKELAGTDGVTQFTDVYQKRARYVVVLYREGYGKTKWTRIEETAVTSRAVDQGWGSLLVVSLDGTAPKWIPASRLWLGIEKFGNRAVADVILDRFADLYQAGHPQSLIEYAKGISQQLASQEKAEFWRQSQDSVRAAAEELANLKQLLTEHVTAINEAAHLYMSIGEPRYAVVEVRSGKRRVSFAWQNPYSNTTKEGYLFVQETELVTDSAFNRTFEPLREVHMRLHGPEPRLWIADEEPDRSFTTSELADWHIRRLLPEQQLHGRPRGDR
jgi:hypothetical protein